MTTPLKMSDLQEITANAVQRIHREKYATPEEVETYFAGIDVGRYQQEIRHAAEEGKYICYLTFHLTNRIGRTLRLPSVVTSYTIWLAGNPNGHVLDSLLKRIGEIRVVDVAHYMSDDGEVNSKLWVSASWS
jgi:hypothetical protein